MTYASRCGGHRGRGVSATCVRLRYCPSFAELILGSIAQHLNGIDAVSVQSFVHLASDTDEIAQFQRVENVRKIFFFDHDEAVGLHHVGCRFREVVVRCNADGALHVFADLFGDGAFHIVGKSDGVLAFAHTSGK